MPFEDFLNRNGIDYKVCRENEPDRKELGLPDSGYVMFRPNADIQKLDILVNPAGEQFRVVNKETVFALREPQYLKAFYKVKEEHNAAKQSNAPIFNIQNAYASVIGTGNHATINYNSAISEMKQAVAKDTSDDKEQLERIVSLLEMVVNDQVPPSKGLFSKFREVMERNSWITGSVANALISWLLTKTV